MSLLVSASRFVYMITQDNPRKEDRSQVLPTNAHPVSRSKLTSCPYILVKGDEIWHEIGTRLAHYTKHIGGSRNKVAIVLHVPE